MSLILSIETATKVCSVALHKSGVLLSQASIAEQYSHFEKLPGLINKVLTQASCELKNIAAIAVSKGPGSYTGLRIGVSMAKGIAFAQDIPILSVNTLEAMAFSAKTLVSSNELLCPMIDARRLEVYCMILNKDMEVVWKTQALVVSENSFDSVTEKNRVILFGDGSLKLKSIFDSNDSIQFENIEPTASAVGRLAWDKFQHKEFEDIAYFEPYYLKDFQPGISKKKLTL